MRRGIARFSFILACIMVFTLISICTVGAETTLDKFADAQISAKKSFANEMNKKCAAASKNGDIKGHDETKINQLREEYMFETSIEQRNLIESQLANYGVYVFGSLDSGNTLNRSLIGIYPSSGSNDVFLMTPIAFYDSIEETWGIACAGNWVTDNCFPTFRLGTNVGDADAFGVGFTSIKNTYNSSVVDTYAYIADEFDTARTTTYYRSDGDGSKGFGFRLQDQVKSVMQGVIYVGYQWFGYCKYDKDFESYACIATAYYIHTYGSAEITSIEFGLEGKTAGISATITNVAKSFTAYSNDLKLND